MERRTFLVLTAAAVGLAGCTSDQPEPAPPGQPESSSPSDPDARVRAEVAASEVALIAAYRAAIQANPEFADDLAWFVVQHQAHLDRVAPGFATPTASPSGSADETTEASAAAVLAGLAEAESVAQAERATACDGAQDPGLARDLCLIAASEAQHAAALEALAAEGTGS